MFDREPNKFHRSDYPIARVAYEVYELRATLSAIFGSKLANLEVKDFIPKFEQIDPTAEVQKTKNKTTAAQRSQAKYLSQFGVNKDGTVEDQRPPAEKALAEFRKNNKVESPAKAKSAKAAQGQSEETPTEQSPTMRNALLRQIKGRKGK